MAKDYYEILKVPKGASGDEIKKSYRKLAMKHHPDRAPEGKKKEYEEKFKEISQAYGVLSDKEKKAQYDQFGQTFEGSSPFGQRDFGSFYDAFGGQDIFEDLGFGRIFEQMFGFGPRQGATQLGQDIVIDIELSLEQAAQGIEKEIEMRKWVTCPECDGKGGKNLKKCPKCHGSGYEQIRSNSIFGMFVHRRPCEKCETRGEIPEKECKDCRGEGRIKQTKKIEVSIPAGISNGQIVKLSGQGEVPLYGGQPGDLYTNVHIKNHKCFERQGDDLIYNLKINYTQAALGDRIEIPILDGKVRLKIPSGIQPGEVIELKGKGMPKLYGRSKGDLRVIVQVEVPKKLSRKQKKILEELSKSE